MISAVQTSCYFCWLAVAGKWHTSSLRLAFTRLVKDEKNGETFHVYCLFLPKAKKEGKRKLG